MEELFKQISSVALQQWAIIIIVAVILILMTRNLSIVPKGKRQTIIELIIETINNWTHSTMGDKYTGFAPYIGTVVIFIFLMNITDLIGLRPVTSNYSVALVLSLTTFVLVQVNAIIKNGGFGYLKGYAQPSAALLPINILERVMLPVIIELLLQALSHLAWFAQLAIPVPFMAYFDLFDAFLQAFIFTTLTMIYIKMTAEE